MADDEHRSPAAPARPHPPPPPGPQEGPRHRRRVRAWPCSVPTSTSSLQVIDDDAGRTLAAASTAEADQRAAGSGSTVAAAARIGQLLAERAKAAGVEQVVFDRGGFLYHGRVAAVAAAAREAGLEF